MLPPSPPRPLTLSSSRAGARARGAKPPLIIVLHGAAKNELDVWNLANPRGEHAGLAPSLLAAGSAPAGLREGFAMVAPYAKGRRSFYEEPRTKVGLTPSDRAPNPQP